MGRKIPGKKHRGVKDPLEQLARKNSSLNLNAPPTNPNEQEVPKSVLEIARLKQISMKTNTLKKKRKKKNKNRLFVKEMGSLGPKLAGMKKKDKEFPALLQWDGETEEHFFRRVNEATDDIINEAQMEADCNVIVKRTAKGNIQSVDKVEIESDEDVSMKKKLKLPKIKLENSEKRNRKQLNRHQRVKLKKKSKAVGEGEKDFSMLTDKVKFGEVVHMPPQLTCRPRGADSSGRKPGQKNLLLKEMLNNSTNSKTGLNAPSMAMKKKIEARRLEVVAAYRELKLARRNKS